MNFVTENTTRFFSVVGAPYIGERHLDNSTDDAASLERPRPAYLAKLPRPCTVGSWLQED